MTENNELRIDRNLLRWIVLAVGLIGLIVMGVALIATPGNRFDTVSYVALAVGILGIGGFVLLDPQAVVQAVTGRTGVYTITSLATSVFFVAVIVGLYLVIQEANIEPADLTKSGEYRLSDTTTDILANLQAPVHVYAFYSQGATSQQEEAEIWLQKYAGASNGQLTYEFIDPDRNPAEAIRLEVDRSGVMVFEQGENRAEATFADERSMTTALVQVTLGEKRKAYFVIGHGERAIDDFTGFGFSEAVSTLQRSNFEVETLNLFTEESVPEDADLVIIAGPDVQYGSHEIEVLNAYLEAGGKVLVMLDPGTGGGTFGGGVLGVAYSASGGRIATAGADGTVKVWDARNLDLPLLTLRGHAAGVVDVSFHPAKPELATLGLDGTVRIWNATSGQEIQALQGLSRDTLRVTYTADGKYLVSVGADGVVNIWDTSTYEGKEPIPTTAQLLAVEAAPEGSTFAVAGVLSTASGGAQGLVYVWDAATGEKLVEQSLHTDVIRDIAYSPDGKIIYSVAEDGTEGTLNLDEPESASTATLFADEGLSALAVAPDGTQIFALLNDFTIHVQKPDTDEDLVLEGHTGQIWKIVVSPQGDRIASASQDGDVRIWNLEDGSLDLTISAHRGGDELLAYLEGTWGIKANDDVVINPFGQFDGFDAGTMVLRGREAYSLSSPVTQPLSDEDSATFFVLARTLEMAELDTLTVAPEAILLSPGGEPPDAPWAETGTFSAASPPEYDADSDRVGPLTLGMAAENSINGSRVVVIGDADFASNNGLSRSDYANSDLLLNIANWLTEGEVIDLPDQNFDIAQFDKPFGQVEMVVVSILSVCLLPTIGLVTGAVVWFVRRRRR